MPGNPLHAEVSADVGGYVSSLSRALGRTESFGDQVRQTSRALDRMGEDASKTGVRLGALSASAGASLVSLLGLSSAATGASSSLTALSVSIGVVSAALGGLVTIATPLVATLGGVVAAATGLAGAFSAVVGSGVVAFGQKRAEQNQKELEQTRARIRELEALQDTEQGLTSAQAKELRQLEEKADKVEETTSVTGALGDVVSDLKAEITPLVAELGEQFIPLIEDAVAAIPRLAEDVIDALGPLDRFRAALRDFGAAAATAIPVMVGLFTDLAREALPVLRDLVAGVGDAAPSAFQRMLDVTRQLGPLLLDLANAAAGLVPPLLEIGTKLLSVVTPAVTGLVESFGDLLGRGTEAIESIADTGMGDVTDIVAALRQNVSDLIPDVVDLGEALAPLFESVLDVLPEILDLTGDATETVLELGEGVAEVAVPPLTNMIEVAGDLADRLDGRVVVALGALVALSGPLSTMAGILGGIGATVASILPSFGVLVGSLTAIAGVSANVISALVPFTGIISSLGATLAPVLGSLTAFVGVSANVVGALIPFTGTVGSLIGTLGGLTGILAGSGGVIGVLGSVGSVLLSLATGPVGILVAAIGGLVLAFEHNLFNIREITEEAFDTLDNIIGDFTTFLKTRAPRLVRTGFRAVGSAIRTVALDVYNAVTGNGDSILRSVITDFVSYLKTDAPSDLKTAANIAFDLLIAAARGLYRGLVGNSILTDIFRDFATYMRKTAPSLLRDAAGVAFDAMTRVAQDAAAAAKRKVQSAFQTLREWFATAWDLHPLSDEFEAVVDAIGQALGQLNFDPLANALDGFADSVSSLISSLNELDGVDINVDVPSFSELLDEARDVVSPPEDDDSGGGSGGGGVGGRDPDDPADAPSATPPGQVDDGGGVGGGPTGGGDDDTNQGIVGGGSGVGPVAGLATGGLIERGGVAMLHEGERVVPEAQIADRGPAPVEGGADADELATALEETDRTDEIVSRLDQLTRAVAELDAGDVTQKDILQALDVAEDRRAGRDPYST
jgi:hypothetical protein